MTAEELTREVRRAGVVLKINGDRLSVDAPKGTLTDSVVHALKENKPAILALLAAEEAAQLAEYGLVRCARCRRILESRHVRDQEGGPRCLDYVDCTAAKLIHDTYAAEGGG